LIFAAGAWVALPLDGDFFRRAAKGSESAAL
jgi:hypothetical protein